MVQNKLPLINSKHGSETRNIINELIKLFNGMGYTYDEALQNAHNVLNEAQKTNDMNKDVQQQIDTLIAESGTSDSEVLQARIDSEGNEYDVLKTRLDEKEQNFSAQLAQTEQEVHSDTLNHLYIETFDGSNEAYHPSVVYFSDGWNGYKYWMAYTPLPYNRAPYDDRWECPSIAVSNDGTTWKTPEGLTNPLQDLTQEQIKRRDYFSDTSLTMNGATMEVWYRHTNGSNTSNTNIYRVTSTDGVNWAEPEIVQDSQDVDNGIGGIGVFFRSQSVFIVNDVYVSIWRSDTGLKRAETNNPSTTKWTNLKEINLIGGSQEPWHTGVVYENGTYHMFSYNRNVEVEYFKSNDGINFQYVKKIITQKNRKHSNLIGLYQSVPVKVGNGWEAYISADLRISRANNPTTTRRGLLRMVGESLTSLTIDKTPKTEKSLAVFMNDILLQNSNKPNASFSRLIWSIDDYGKINHGLGLISQSNKRLIPAYIHPTGSNPITTAYIGYGEPSQQVFRYIGEIYIDLLDPNNFYVATGENKWTSARENSLILKSRENLSISSTLIIDNNVYRVVLNSGDASDPLNNIIGGTDGQEIIILNTLTTVQITNNFGGEGNIRLKQNTNLNLLRYSAIKLHNISGVWYEI